MNKNGDDKCKGTKKVEKATFPDLSIFPETILFNILVKLPPRYIREKVMGVCKPWKEMFSRRFFIDQNFVESNSGLLMQAPSGRHMRTRLLEFGNDLEVELHDPGISHLGEARPGCDGFMLINKPKNTGEMVVINPVTKISKWPFIPKPPSGCKHKACSAAIGFDSRTNQYKVVHVLTDSYRFEIFNLSSGDDQQWEKISSPWEDPYDRPFNPLEFHWKDPVSINGRVLHWYVDSSEYIISMQVKEGRFSRTYLPSIGKDIKLQKYTLIELGGYLSFTYCDSETKMDIWILVDFQESVWSKKHSIEAELITFMCPKESSSQFKNSMPNLDILDPVGGTRNGEVLILKHNKNHSIYIYDTKMKVMKKVKYSMKNKKTSVPHKPSLFSSMKKIS